MAKNMIRKSNSVNQGRSLTSVQMVHTHTSEGGAPQFLLVEFRPSNYFDISSIQRTNDRLINALYTMEWMLLVKSVISPHDIHIFPSEIPSFGPQSVPISHWAPLAPPQHAADHVAAGARTDATVRFHPGLHGFWGGWMLGRDSYWCFTVLVAYMVSLHVLNKVWSHQPTFLSWLYHRARWHHGKSLS